LITESMEAKPRGARIVALLMAHAPDSHAVLTRVSLRTGVPLDKLQEPERLDDAEVRLLEQAAKDILGVEQLDL